jgi:DNA-binding NtrC family response regulator
MTQVLGEMTPVIVPMLGRLAAFSGITPYPLHKFGRIQLACFLLRIMSMNILIVSDNKLIRWVLQEVCIQEGHDVSFAENAEEAFGEVESNPFDIVFAHLEMENTDAARMVRDLLQHQPETSLVVISALQPQEIGSLLGDIKIFRIIEKPVEATVIRSIIEKVSNKRKIERRYI